MAIGGTVLIVFIGHEHDEARQESPSLPDAGLRKTAGGNDRLHLDDNACNYRKATRICAITLIIAFALTE